MLAVLEGTNTAGGVSLHDENKCIQVIVPKGQGAFFHSVSLELTAVLQQFKFLIIEK